MTHERETPASASTGLSETLPDELKTRLAALAKRMDRSPDECLRQAVTDYCETWEDYHRTVDALLEDEDERQSLRVVNE